MKRQKFLYLSIQQFVLLIYFLLTTIMFLLALKQGNEGVSFKIFGEGDDGYFYWIQAQNVAAGNPWINTSIYPWIIGNLIKFTGIDSVYLIRIFNYLGFVFLISFLYQLINTQFWYNRARLDGNYIYKTRSLLLICLLFYASLQMNVNLSILRDIWIYLFFVISTYLSVKLIFYSKHQFLYLILLLASLWMLGEFRGYALLSFLIALIIYFVYKNIRLLKNPKKIIFLGIILFVLYYTFFLDFTIGNMSLKKALNYRLSGLILYSGGSQMWINLDQPNVILFLFNYIHSFFGNFIGPLPWHISGLSTMFVFFVETLPMIFIIRFIWLKRMFLSKVQKYILLQAIVWNSLIAITNDNLGTASRLRPVTWILILTVFVTLYNSYKDQLLTKKRGEKIEKNSIY